MNKKHILLIVLLFSTIVLFSVQKGKLKLTHGYIVVSYDKGISKLPCQLALSTINDSINSIVELPPAKLLLSGTILTKIDKKNNIDVGIVFLNPWEQENHIKFKLIDIKKKKTIFESEMTLPPHNSIARMLSTMDKDLKLNLFDGYFSFESQQGVASLDMQISPEATSSIPVFETFGNPPQYLPQKALFPHFATGAGYRSTLVVWNPFHDNINVKVQFFASDGEPLPVLARNESGTEFYFNLLPKDKISIPILPLKQ